MKRPQVDFDERLWRGYQQGRALSPKTLSVWMDAVEAHAPSARPLEVLDLGSGTGRFSPSLAERFGGQVYGVEPSARMREVAIVSSAHPSVTYLDGCGEAIPLPDASCDVAFLFFAMHHFSDRVAAARELARVVKPGGVVCARTHFADRLDSRHNAWQQYFPRALEIERTMFPPLATVTAEFEVAGLEVVALDQVEYEIATSLGAYLERLRLRAVSTLEHLTEQELEDGFAAMEHGAALAGETPIIELGDLLVLSHRPQETAS